MYQAVYVEDEIRIGKHVLEVLEKEFLAHGVNVEFEMFSRGDTFLAEFEKHYHYDMIFLDIEMPGLDGFDVCRRIRAIKPEALVVFVTNREELVFQSFEVQPFRFVRKSDLAHFAPSLTEALIRELERRNQKLLHIEEDGSGTVYSFDPTRLMYAEAQGKFCRLVSEGSEVTVRLRFMDLEARLPADSFYRIHRSFLVNFRYVFYIGKNEVHLTDKTALPVSRGRSEEIKAAYMQYLEG